MRYLGLFLLLFLTGCYLNCSTVQTVEQRDMPQQEEYYETEIYYIKEPYFEDETQLVEVKVPADQELVLKGCADILRISNPSEDSIKIKFNKGLDGYFQMHALQPMRADASSTPSIIIPVHYIQSLNSFLTTGTIVTIPKNSYIDMRYMGLMGDQTSCADTLGAECLSYDDCDPSLGNPIFDTERIQKTDISFSGTLSTVTKFVEQTVTVKKYQKVPKNRTVQRTRTVYIPQNVTIKKRVC